MVVNLKLGSWSVNEPIVGTGRDGIMQAADTIVRQHPGFDNPRTILTVYRADETEDFSQPWQDFKGGRPAGAKEPEPAEVPAAVPTEAPLDDTAVDESVTAGPHGDGEGVA